MGKKLDLTGQTFGYLTVLRVDAEKRDNRRYLCRCECGREKSVRVEHLRGGDTKSCGQCGLVPNFGVPKYFLTFAGKTAPLSEWAEITGLPHSALISRLKSGWPIEEILFTRLRPGRVKFKPETEDAPPDETEGTAR